MVSLIALARALYPICAWFPHGVSGGGGIPVNTVLPTISGTAIQVGLTINVSNGSWTQSPTSYTYQWQNEGANLSGSGNPTTNAYTLQTTDIGALITCVVTAHNSSGASSPTRTALAGPAIGATAFYVSQSAGNDSNAGTFASPWKTLTKVNAYSASPGFSAGTSVLFKRGDTWRTDGCATSSGAQLSPASSGSSGNPIVFDAYGTGANPIIDGSIDLSTTGAWTNISGNVWGSVHTFNGFGHANGLPNNAADDVGSLIWGISAVGGTNVPTALVNASYGVMKGNTSSPFNGIWYKTGDNQANLTSTGQWNFNTDTNKIQVYSVGNPATSLPGVSTDLRGAVDTCCIYFNAQTNIIFQNFTLQYCGATAIDTGGAGGSCNNIIIRDMVVQWIGGGNIGGPNVSTANSRYGDGYDVEGSCSGILMDRIWWHQIYDTGPGPQCGGGPHQDNITVRNNVCTYCGAFFSSFFLGGTPTASGLSIYNNTVYCTANAWSNNPSQRPNSLGFNENVTALVIDTLVSGTVTQTNLSVRNNIFAGISGVGTSPGFGIDGTGWNVGGGVNSANPYTASGPGGTGAWLDYNCWPVNTASPVGAPAQDIALAGTPGGNHAMSDWVKGTNVNTSGTFSPPLEVHGIFSQDPLFTNQAAFNFILGPTSPGRLAGSNLFSSPPGATVPPGAPAGIVWDFNHKPRPSSGAFSMGAFQ